LGTSGGALVIGRVVLLGDDVLGEVNRRSWAIDSRGLGRAGYHRGRVLAP